MLVGPSSSFQASLPSFVARKEDQGAGEAGLVGWAGVAGTRREVRKASSRVSEFIPMSLGASKDGPRG